MSRDYFNYNFIEGTYFERALMRFMWWKYKDKKTSFCKPDIYDVSTNTFYEAKGTRPYYKYNPAEMPPDEFDNKDLGSGLPSKQFDRYMKIVENGGNVELVGF